ncbi:hypothetical protein [Phaffia rhodozyma]|uniref:Uncharacterized protein n=1 Tax=Phaffia rhodozyma TaxID=264483 RepID=A0A0F7SHR7_PHARH|nr:hypothetical protein [Phaffia rhodozyma]
MGHFRYLNVSPSPVGKLDGPIVLIITIINQPFSSSVLVHKDTHSNAPVLEYTVIRSDMQTPPIDILSSSSGRPGPVAILSETPRLTTFPSVSPTNSAPSASYGATASSWEILLSSFDAGTHSFCREERIEGHFPSTANITQPARRPSFTFSSSSSSSMTTSRSGPSLLSRLLLHQPPATPQVALGSVISADPSPTLPPRRAPKFDPSSDPRLLGI